MQGVIDYTHGISAVDSLLLRPLQSAVHVVVERGRAAIIDTAASHCVPRVLDALAAKGVPPEHVDWIVLTHIHLDHAGGAGEFMRRCPNARLTVHPLGARHMVDPAKLIDGTIGVYGEAETRRMYGDILPVPAERIETAQDGGSIRLAGRELSFYDAPGHARHHVVVRDSASGHIFAGDAFGLSYRELDLDGRQFAFPTTTPVHFDPPALHRSVDRMLALEPKAIYVMHFGRVDQPQRMAADLHRLIDEHVRIALEHRQAGAGRHQRLKDGLQSLVLAEARRQGWRLSPERLLAVFREDFELNAQGLGVWLDTQRA